MKWKRGKKKKDKDCKFSITALNFNKCSWSSVPLSSDPGSQQPERYLHLSLFSWEDAV
ncbi:hypothetical protein STEG23_037628, partial [Scotinomys teguina]